jgi:pimeloyl-ACP methyl ester carboxylesterase
VAAGLLDCQSHLVVDSEFDQAVNELITAYAVPRRLREARVADGLQAVEPQRIACRWGDLSAWRLGTGPAVLLVHGFQDDNSLWSPLIDELDRRGRGLVAFDLPAHGSSGGTWGVAFEGTDAIVAVAGALGPIDVVVAHSAGCGMAVGAIGEGWTVPRGVFVAPPLGQADRWARYGERLGVSPKVVEAGRSRYYAAHGPARAAWQPRIAYTALNLDLLVIHSRDDEHQPVSDSEAVIPLIPGATLELVDGLTHRKTARDPAVVTRIADFVTA